MPNLPGYVLPSSLPQNPNTSGCLATSQPLSSRAGAGYRQCRHSAGSMWAPWAAGFAQATRDNHQVSLSRVDPMPWQSTPAIVCKGPSPGTAVPSASFRGDPSLVHLMFTPRKPSPAVCPFLLSPQSSKRAATKDELWAPP